MVLIAAAAGNWRTTKLRWNQSAVWAQSFSQTGSLPLLHSPLRPFLILSRHPGPSSVPLTHELSRCRDCCCLGQLSLDCLCIWLILKLWYSPPKCHCPLSVIPILFSVRHLATFILHFPWLLQKPEEIHWPPFLFILLSTSLSKAGQRLTQTVGEHCRSRKEIYLLYWMLSSLISSRQRNIKHSSYFILFLS